MTNTDEKAAEAWANYNCPEQGSEYIGWCINRTAFLAGIAHARRWIPVTERLPANGQLTVVRSSPPFEDSYYVLTFSGNKWLSEDSSATWEIDEIQCWLPLPAAPEAA